jgi:hypothetical protein
VHELGEASHSYVWDVGWNNAGDRLASIDHLGRLNLWNAKDGGLIEQSQIAHLDHPRLDWRPAEDFLILGGTHPQIINASPLKPAWTDDETYRGWHVEFRISPNGKFRILVKPNPEQPEWPHALRVGGGTNNMMLLEDVPVWYELWRQINGFPPNFYVNIDGENKGNQNSGLKQ